MVFSSLIFLFAYLPAVWLIYFVTPRKGKNLALFLVSLIFYAWGEPIYVLLMLASVTLAFLFGLVIGEYRKEKPRVAKLFTILSVCVSLSFLLFFKYYNFFVQSFTDVFLGGNADGLLLKVILPVGISFYTFQALSYSIDVYKKKLKPTRDIIAFFAFISFFPQLVAGPIERATNLLPQFQKPRMFDYATAVDGCRQILWGLFKKVVVADNCAVIVNQIFSDYADKSGSVLMVGALFFTFQIYGDFSGYSDIAIGTAKLFGVKLMQNFKVPYFSRDIAEFWRRWHISLTTWFRDYVYIPLGGSRCSKAKIIRNTFVIFLVSGFWHGANWTFIVWGAYHALLFLPLILLGKNRKYTNTVAEGRILPSLKEFFQMVLTFLLVVIGWVIFRAETIGDVVLIMKTIFSLSLFTTPDKHIFLCFVILMTLILEWVARTKSHPLELLNLCNNKIVRYGVYTFFVFFIFFCMSKPQPFVYFQF